MTNDPSREGRGQWSAQRPPAADPSGRGSANPLALPPPDWPDNAGSPPDPAATHDFGDRLAPPGQYADPGRPAEHSYPDQGRGYSGDAGPSGFSAAEFAADDRRDLAPADFAASPAPEYPYVPNAEYPYVPAAVAGPQSRWLEAPDPHRTGTHRVEARDPGWTAGQPAYGKPYSGQPYGLHSRPPEPGGRFPSPPQFDATGQHTAMELAPSREHTGSHPARRPEPQTPGDQPHSGEYRQHAANTTSAYPTSRTGDYSAHRTGEYPARGAEPQHHTPAAAQPEPHNHTGAYPATQPEPHNHTGGYPAAQPEPQNHTGGYLVSSAEPLIAGPAAAPDPGPASGQFPVPTTGQFPVQHTGEHPGRPLTAFAGGPHAGHDPSVTTFLPPVTSGGQDGHKTGLYAPVAEPSPDYPEYPAEFEAAEERLGAVRGDIDEPIPPVSSPPARASAPAADERPIPVRRPKPKRKRRLALAGIVALALVSAGAGTAVYLVKPRALKDAPTAGPLSAAGPGGAGPVTGIAEAPLRSDNKLASRATDPEPLKLAELTAASYTGLAGDYTRTGDDASADCAAAADPAVARTLRDLGCSQAVSVTAVNAEKGCVVTFGALNLPDQASAGKLVEAMRDGKIGSFIPRRHNKPAEGSAGGPESTWWFLLAPHGHWVAYATGAYAAGTTITGRDPGLVDCDTDMVRAVQHRLDARK